MWVNRLHKAESLVMLSRFQQAQDILDQFERAGPEITPEADLGLALHQIGNAFLGKKRFDEADRAFELAIKIRKGALALESDTEVLNHLAGSHKMRAVVRLMKQSFVGPDPRLMPEARQEIGEAVRIRGELIAEQKEDGSVPLSFLYDYAMTLNTNGNVDGREWKFDLAMPALESATNIMQALVKENEEWLPDLGICLVDRVLYGVGASRQAGFPPPLDEAEECFLFYRQRLAKQLLENSGVQTKYLQFLGQAAAPAAYFSNRVDRACVFIEAGLELIERVRSKYGSVLQIAASATYLFDIPPNAVDAMVESGFDHDRFFSLRQEVVASLGQK